MGPTAPGGSVAPPVPAPPPANDASPIEGGSAVVPPPKPDSDSGPGDAASPSSASVTRAAFLAQLQGIVGTVPALDPQLVPATTVGAIVQQDFTIASTPAWRVPGTLRKPAGATGKLPVLICLHETGADRNSPNVVSIVTTMTGRGFLTVAISGRYFGQPNGDAAYIAAMKAAYAMPGKDYPFLYDTVWDVIRTIDYLSTRDDVDPGRIGLTGISKGGMETYLAAAVDTRVAAAAPIIGVQSFKWGLENGAFQARAASLGGAVPNPMDATSVRMFYDRVAPGLVDLYDGPEMLPLIAPRPLIVLSGTQDPRNAIGGVQVAVNAAQAAYAQAGFPERFKFFAANVGHDGSYVPFHDEAMAWIGQWLGTAADAGP
jgi:dienelactone hydrolase